MKAKLYLIGIGPGDPELLTLKAARILGETDCVSYPQKPSSKSFAHRIAKDHLSEKATLLPIDLPMKIAREPAKLAYDLAEIAISEKLDAGKSVAYLCEGDPLFFGSAMYLLERLGEKYDVEIVPGITSLSAASAAIGRPLVARSERLKVLTATLGDDILLAELAQCEAAAILKIGRHFDRVKNILIKTGHIKNAWIIENASSANQSIMRLEDFSTAELPYFSIVLCYAGDEVWQSETWVKNREEN